MHGDEHLVGDRVVGDVADLAAEVDSATYLRGAGVDDRFGAAGFVGGPHRTAFRVVRDPVRIVTGGSLSDHGSGVFVKDYQAVVAGGGDVDPAQFGDDEDSMCLGQVRNRSDHLSGVDVDFDDLAGAEVGNEQQSTLGVEALVIEA